MLDSRYDKNTDLCICIMVVYNFQLLPNDIISSLFKAFNICSFFACIDLLCYIGLGYLMINFFLILHNSDKKVLQTRKLCNCMIRNYIFSFDHINAVPAHIKDPDIFTPFIAWENGSENI